MARLAPLPEEPINEDAHPPKRTHSFRSWLAKRTHSFSHWLRHHQEHSDLRLLLSVIGCPLSPVSLLPKHPLNATLPISSSAQYIIHQFRATTGSAVIEESGGIKSMYASGRLKTSMSHHELRPQGSSSSPSDHHEGRFVLWQMHPGMWLFDLSVSGHQIIAGSDGRLAWRHTPWLGPHAASGGARPLRRAIQGLDPVAIATVFSNAEHTGEKAVGEEECFVLKLDVEGTELSRRSDEATEVISHVMVGYFSQRSGLLVRLEDTQLAQMQHPGARAMYWRTTIVSSVEDYREVDGVKIAHSGSSVVNLERFGFGVKERLQVSMRMEEEWSIDDVVFNVAGLSADYFLPPVEVCKNAKETVGVTF